MAEINNFEEFWNEWGYCFNADPKKLCQKLWEECTKLHFVFPEYIKVTKGDHTCHLCKEGQEGNTYRYWLDNGCWGLSVQYEGGCMKVVQMDGPTQPGCLVGDS